MDTRYNPTKNDPKKIDPDKLRDGLSSKQLNKIAYECDLLRKNPQELLNIAPHMFNDNTTAANSTAKDPLPIIEERKPSTRDYVDDEYDPYGYSDEEKDFQLF